MIRTLLFSAAAAMTVSLGTLLPTAAAAGPTEDYAAVLEARLSPGPDGVLVFDYAAAKDADHAVIKAFIAEQAALSPSTLERDEALAYWANLYNAVTLDVVLENYPLKTIRSLGFLNSGPWNKEVVTVEGEALSLNNIEHDIMRAKYPTPYIHYMVNCASMGCPNLVPTLWSADTLAADQTAAAHAFVNANRGVEIVKGDRLALSRIYKWYEDDFGTKDERRAHLLKHATGRRAELLQSGARIDGYHYDWDLNDHDR